MERIKKRDVLASQLREHIPVDDISQDPQQGLVKPRNSSSEK